MVYSKTFPRNIEGSSYPRWEEVSLTSKEEQEQEMLCRKRNKELMKECILDAKSITQDLTLKDFQSDVIHIANALFEKRASHEVFWKEAKCKEKFDTLFSEVHKK